MANAIGSSPAIGISPYIPVVPSALRGQSLDLSDAARGFGSALGQKQAAVTENQLLLIGARLAAAPGDAARQAALLQALPALAQPSLAATARAALPEADSGRQGIEHLLAQVGEMFLNSDRARLEERMSTFVARSQANQARFDALSAELDALKGVLEPALEHAIAAGEAVAEATAAVKTAQDEVDRLQALLDGVEADSPEAAVIRTELEAAQGVVTQARTTLAAAAGALEKANAAAITAGDAYDGKASEIETLIAAIPGSATVPPKLSHEGKLTELMAIISELIADAAMDGLSEDLSMQQQRLEAQRVENEKRAKEVEESARKAAAAQKTMGSIGKVLGYIVAVAAVALAVVTLGTATAVSVAMIAGAVVSSAMLATMVVGDIAGYDLIGKALSPITEGIFSPIIDFVTKAAIDIFGEEAGRWIGTVLAAVLIVAMIAAVVFVTKQVGPASQKLLAPVLKGTIDKVLPKVATEAMKQMFKPIIKAVSTAVAKRNAMVANFSEQTAMRVATATTRAGMVQAGLTVAQTGAHVGGAAWVGSRNVASAKSNAAFEEALFNSAMLRSMNESMYEKMSAMLAALDALIETIGESMSSYTSGMAAMMQHSRPTKA